MASLGSVLGPHNVHVSALLWRWRRVYSDQNFMSTINLQEGRDRSHQYCWLGSTLWPRPRPIHTKHLSSERKSGCVEKRGKGSAHLSKANRKTSLPQVQLLYVTIRRKVGSLSGPYEVDPLFHQSPFWQKCPSEVGLGREEISQSKQQSFSCLVWLGS